MQVSIAAVLGELHRFGLNIKALRAVADILQGGVEVGETMSERPFVIWLAARLAFAIANFDAGKEVLVWAKDADDIVSRPATSHLEIAIGEVNGDETSPEHLLAMAYAIGADRALGVILYSDLVEAMDTAGNTQRCSWLIWQDDAGWNVDRALDDTGFNSAVEPASGIYVAVSGIMFRMWSIDLDARRQYREEQRLRYIATLPTERQDFLAKARRLGSAS